MDKTPLYFLFVAALFGGILCDQYIGTTPVITLILLAMAGVIFYVVTNNLPDDKEK